jgi:hypothetical protein
MELKIVYVELAFDATRVCYTFPLTLGRGNVAYDFSNGS